MRDLIHEFELVCCYSDIFKFIVIVKAILSNNIKNVEMTNVLYGKSELKIILINKLKALDVSGILLRFGSWMSNKMRLLLKEG